MARPNGFRVIKLRIITTSKATGTTAMHRALISFWLGFTVLVLALPTNAAPFGDWNERLTFYASFDEQLDADIAQGDPKIYTAADLSRTEVTAGVPAQVEHASGGRSGRYLKFMDNTKSVVFFKGEQNVPYSANGYGLTISFWMLVSPDQDLKPGYVDPLQITDKKWNDASIFVDFTKDDTPRHFRLGVFSDYKFWNPDDTKWEEVKAEDRPFVSVPQPPFKNSRWTHVALTFKDINRGSTSDSTLYLDGKAQGVYRSPIKMQWTPEKVAIMLGIQYIGGIDDLAIFDGAMSATDVQQLAQAETDVAATDAADEGGWITMFNGKDLEGWTPKIRYAKLGDNYGNTFRVEDGLLKVRYDAYDEFGERFGHLFYHKSYSNYDMRVEYRFVGEQTKNGPGWAIRNSGIMIHGQDPATMKLDQDFPVSIEVQLLGGLSNGKRTTSNLCTPGTNVVMEGELIRRHCTSSRSKTYDGEQWVTAEIKVRGNRIIEHIVNGELVLSYTKPQLDDRDQYAKELLKTQHKMLEGGTISLQSESHPVDFRRVEIRPVPAEN